MYTTNCKKFKGEIENYLSKEKNIFESRIDRAFRMLHFKTQLNRAKIRKKDGYQATALTKWRGGDTQISYNRENRWRLFY
jgi:3-dehydroquinate dehydratase